MIGFVMFLTVAAIVIGVFLRNAWPEWTLKRLEQQFELSTEPDDLLSFGWRLDRLDETLRRQAGWLGDRVRIFATALGKDIEDAARDRLRPRPESTEIASQVRRFHSVFDLIGDAVPEERHDEYLDLEDAIYRLDWASRCLIRIRKRLGTKIANSMRPAR